MLQREEALRPVYTRAGSQDGGGGRGGVKTKEATEMGAKIKERKKQEQARNTQTLEASVEFPDVPPPDVPPPDVPPPDVPPPDVGEQASGSGGRAAGHPDKRCGGMKG